MDDVDDAGLRVREREDHAAGATAVVVALQHGVEQMGPLRTARTLLRLHQVDGFDCQGCAWPDPDPEHRHTAEFCENGAKAVAEEATLRRVTRDFWTRHTLDDLAGRSDHWLGQRGRLTEPVVRRPGSDHDEPISCSEAFELIGEQLRSLPSPDAAAFHTSGRTSAQDCSTVRHHIAAVVTRCEDHGAKVRAPGGFQLPHAPRDSRTSTTASGRAVFPVVPLSVLTVADDQLVLQTLRSHDRCTTTIHGLDDRYRGISGGRRVVFLNPEDARDRVVITLRRATS